MLEVIRGNYDTLTLKLQENLDNYEKYVEKPKESSFFTQLVSMLFRTHDDTISHFPIANCRAPMDCLDGQRSAKKL